MISIKKLGSYFIDSAWVLPWLYLALAFLLPWIPIHQPPDATVDYLPMRDLIMSHPLTPLEWIPDHLAYRGPGYALFLALIGVISKSEVLTRCIQGLLLFHSLLLGSRITQKLKGDPRIFQWIWTLSGAHIYFSQLILSETLTTWILLMAFSGTQIFLTSLLLFLKPAYLLSMPAIAWPWKKNALSLVIIFLCVFSWGMLLKNKAGKFIYIGSGGGLNLFISTLPETFKWEGAALDTYWQSEERKIASPQKIGWYKFDDELKAAALSKFPNWNICSARFWSPFFGQQYVRGVQLKLLPFGLILFFGLVLSFRYLRSKEVFPIAGTLISIFFVHLIVAPFARFVLPLIPLAAILIALYFEPLSRNIYRRNL